jgi:conjugative relaxase-like TrwC/TraI family protein
MLTVHKLTGRRAARTVDYFTGDEREYYVNGDGERARSPGRWMGRLAANLGLAGEVSLDEFLRVLDGEDPRTGTRWVRARKNHLAGTEMAASPPKSVSAAGVLSSRETATAINEALDFAAEVVLDYVVGHVKMIRRGRNGVYPETARELLAVAFDHSTSRQTKQQVALGMPPDPSKHKHMILPVARRHDGELAAIDFRALKIARQELEAVYHAALATKLAELGFTIERETSRGFGFEIAGIPRALCEDWSSRTHEIHQNRPVEIAEFREKYGREPTNTELRDLDLRCKMAKGRSLRDVGEFWRLVGAAHGVTADTIEGLRRRNVLPSPGDGRAQVRAELLAEDGLTREHAAFTTRQLRIAAFRKSAGVITVADTERVIGDLIRSGDVVSVGKNRWTTRAMLDAEKGVLAWREGRRSLASPPRPSSRLVWRAIRGQQKGRGVTFATEQVTALHAMLTQRFTAVTGAAGTGKTAIIGAAADIWRAHHRRVFAVAVAGATAQRLAEDLAEGAEGMTLDGLIVRLERGRLELRENDVIVVDEAGMIDTPRWARFASVVKDQATIVVLGDHAQLSPLSAGGLWPLLAEGGPQLQQVHRTTVRWERAAWTLLRTGEAEKALRLYARCGHVSMSATRPEARSAAVNAWDADGRTGVIITDSSNAERDAMNIAAQQRRRAAGELGDTGVALAPAGPEFRCGDRVIFRRQWRIGGGVRRVENGTTGHIVGADCDRNVVTVRTGEQHPRDLEVGRDADPLLELAYASHVYKAQGMTVGTSYIVSGGWQTHREALYVACSRSREGTWLFLDRESLDSATDADALAVMAERGQRSRTKRAATAPPSPASAPGKEAATTPAAARRRARPLRPLTERYRRRQQLRRARAEGRRTRAKIAAFARVRRRWAQPLTVAEVAFREEVPEWVVRAYEEVTDIPYVQRDAV